MASFVHINGLSEQEQQKIQDKIIETIEGELKQHSLKESDLKKAIAKNSAAGCAPVGIPPWVCIGGW